MNEAVAKHDSEAEKPDRMGFQIVIGMFLGIAAGLLFGESCAQLDIIGQTYVGLLQMTVMPYLVITLIARLGRLTPSTAKRLGFSALIFSAILWIIGVILVTAVTMALPEIQGASFFSPTHDTPPAQSEDFLTTFIPHNIFQSLASEYVPAVVVFCLFFGTALMLTPKKESLLDFLDLCGSGIGRMNLLLIRLSPLGLFALSASAAGTLQFHDMARLQAYLITFFIAAILATFVAIPLLVTSLTNIGYLHFIKAIHGPSLTAIATGKLFVVLPNIAEESEKLLIGGAPNTADKDDTTASVVVPLAYPFPHMGKILAFAFIPFAAWYVGTPLSPIESASMASTGVVSSFANPLISMPYMLDSYLLPQDLMALFILPGFLTTRIADVVGVAHLMALTVLVTKLVNGDIQFRGIRLLASVGILAGCLLATSLAGHSYLRKIKLDYKLDEKLLSLEIKRPFEDVIVKDEILPVENDLPDPGPTLARLRKERVLRVGYQRNHIPYSYFNTQYHLVGFDVELMHRLASRLQVRLEFIPYRDADSIVKMLDAGQIDLATSGLVIKPEKLLEVGFTEPYQIATMSLLVADHRTDEFRTVDQNGIPTNFRKLAYDEPAATLQLQQRYPEIQLELLRSVDEFFTRDRSELDGMLLPAEEASAWNVLYPNHSVVIPQPALRRPVGLAVRRGDLEWVQFLDRFIEFEEMNGTLQQLRDYWVHGKGTETKAPRWCIMRDVLHWIP